MIFLNSFQRNWWLLHPLFTSLFTLSFTARTLPHCYVQVLSIEKGNEMIQRCNDPERLDLEGKNFQGRKVRVVWERPGEMMRDLYEQDLYFRVPPPLGQSLSAAELPSAPRDYQLPPQPLTKEDFEILIAHCHAWAAFDDLPIERPFLNVATLVARYPWARPELSNVEFVHDFFTCAYVATHIAIAYSKVYPELVPVVQILLHSMRTCPYFTEYQKKSTFELEEGKPTYPMPTLPLLFCPPSLVSDQSIPFAPEAPGVLQPVQPPPSPPVSMYRRWSRTAEGAFSTLVPVNSFPPAPQGRRKSTARLNLTSVTKQRSPDTPPSTPPPPRTVLAPISSPTPTSTPAAGTTPHGSPQNPASRTTSISSTPTQKKRVRTRIQPTPAGMPVGVGT
ncbi:hypothetical protein T439DRAFT_143643 [Meredithblackwellia eburnea MCA 4105]